MSVIIYKITSPCDTSYIGQVIREKGIMARWKQHINSAKSNPEKGCRYLNRAILKYGHNSFKVEKICEIHENLKDVTEQLCIKLYKTLAPDGYNLQTGGTHTIHSEYTKNKRSESLKLLLKDTNKRKIWSEAKKGIPQNNKKNRKYEEDYLLPKYIRRIRGTYSGYCIDSHPLCRSKKFTSKKITDIQKYNLTIEFLNKLNNMVAVQRLNGNG